MNDLPHSVEAEQSLIGAIFVEPDSWNRVAGLIAEEDFYRADHKLIIGAIRTLANNADPYDIVTVAEYLERCNNLEQVGGLSYLAMIAMNTPSANNIQAYASVVRKRAMLRSLQKICATTQENISNPGDKSVDEIITLAQTSIDELMQMKPDNAYSWLDVLGEADQAIQEAKNRNEKGNPVGIPTGLKQLDDRIGGLPNKRLILIAGRPSLGKTAFAQQIVLHTASLGKAVGICSLEMGADELGIRSYANTLEVNGTALQFGNQGMIEKYTERLHNSPILKYRIWVDDSTYSLGGIVARAHEWRHEYKIDLFVVDHIGLVEHAADSANQRLGEITRSLKKLAKRLNIPVLAVCQLNRSVEKEKRRPRLSDLRDSGNIEQDCDVALFLHSDDEDENHVKDIELGALKVRYGRKGWLSGFEFDGRIQKFLEKRYAEV